MDVIKLIRTLVGGTKDKDTAQPPQTKPTPVRGNCNRCGKALAGVSISVADPSPNENLQFCPSCGFEVTNDSAKDGSTRDQNSRAGSARDESSGAGDDSE